MDLNGIFEFAKKKGASDVHIVVGKPPIVRIEGVLHEMDDKWNISNEEAEQLIYKILDAPQKERLTKERDLDFAHEISDGIRFRVNCHYEKGNIGLVARLIPSEPPKLEDIGAQDIIYDLARAQQGLVLVTGPTGHGKSTTLAAMINLINNERSEHIVTLEDPIEFLFRPKKSIIKQRQLGTDILSFEAGLKHVLRQDPNVIMVGEMRDLETVAATITLAETGHLVLATLHTISASQTIDRIIDIFPPYQQDQIKMQLSISLRAVITQRLLPKKDGSRLAAREVMTVTPAVANMIREDKIPQMRSVIQTSAKDGMVTMDQDILRLYKEGLIEQEIAERYLTDPGLLK